jgi:lysyl-tRNA synthetase class 2
MEIIEKIRKLKIDPYPEKSFRDLEISLFLKNFNKYIKNKKRFWLVGRIMSLRDHKNIIFMDIKDFSGKIQVIFKKDITHQFNLVSEIFTIGDFINVYGKAFLPQSKEKSLLVEKFNLLSKAINILPKDYYKIKDEELLVRYPYFRTIFYDEDKEIFKKRFLIIQILRKILWNKGFIEVETPILQTHYGGALAKPFKAYLESLDIPVYLRIAPELYLKKMLVGGFEKIFEIGKNFRNEGIDREHNPEFTMMELYYAYCDREGLMNFMESLLKELVENFNKEYYGKKSSVIVFQGNKIDFGKKWKVFKFIDIIKKYTKLDYFKNNLNDFISFAKSKNIEFNPKYINKGKIVDEIFKKLIRKNLIQPTFLIDHPTEISPLAKLNPRNKDLTLRFQGYIGGLEIINGFSELNDPIDQQRRFEEEAKLKEKGDEEAHPYDETFIEALKYGMPPTAGVGLGIDRMVMVFTDSKYLRQVLYFPFTRDK